MGLVYSGKVPVETCAAGHYTIAHRLGFPQLVCDLSLSSLGLLLSLLDVQLFCIALASAEAGGLH